MFDGAVTAKPPCHHVRAGYGLIPRLTAARTPIYGGRLDAAEAARRTAISHTPYHAALAELTEATVARHVHSPRERKGKRARRSTRHRGHRT